MAQEIGFNTVTDKPMKTKRAPKRPFQTIIDGAI